MQNERHPHASLVRLIEGIKSLERADSIFGAMWVPPEVMAVDSDHIPRAVLTMGLNMILFEDLLARVPTAAAYTNDRMAGGERVVHDHGALRTVNMEGMGSLPSGRAAFTRILLPLGYELAGEYPLERLNMMGYAYAHQDFPETLPQFFVSELLVDRFSPSFQEAASRVFGSSRDPLPDVANDALRQLARQGTLPLVTAQYLVLTLAKCFGRQHRMPSLADYEIFRKESPEMAWISTEGNAFNHVTDRVDDIEAVSNGQREIGRPIKDAIEVSAAGSVKQTAFHAARVMRQFVADGHAVVKEVPGSFYEFIERHPLNDGDVKENRLDLRFDSSNAQGIFKMTDAGATPAADAS